MGKHSITLSDEQRHTLENLIQPGTVPARSIKHAHIMLKADTSSHGPRWSDQQIEQAFAVSYRTNCGPLSRKTAWTGTMDAAITRLTRGGIGDCDEREP